MTHKAPPSGGVRVTRKMGGTANDARCARSSVCRASVACCDAAAQSTPADHADHQRDEPSLICRVPTMAIIARALFALAWAAGIVLAIVQYGEMLKGME